MSRAVDRLSRRGLLAGASAAVLAAGLPRIATEARPFPLRGGHPRISGGGGSTPAYTLTFANTAGTDTPSDIPLQAMQWFGAGDVPAGKIAVPTYGGTDLVYQADAVVYWGDGSLRGANYRIARSGAITAGSTFQITWSIRSGSYSNTSAITTATLTGETDFRVALSKVHTAGVDISAGVGGRAVAITINNATGQVTGGRGIFPNSLTTLDGDTNPTLDSTTTGTIDNVSTGSLAIAASSGFPPSAQYYLIGTEIVNATYASNALNLTVRGAFGSAAASHAAGETVYRLYPVTGGGGTGAYVYAVGGTLFAPVPGSGYAYTGAGSFEIALNDIIAGVNSSGNRTSGRRLEWYARGPVCDAVRVTTTVSGMNHAHVTFYLERWKKADGTLLGYKMLPMLANGLVDTVNGWPCYTYDLNVKSGASTVLLGASNSDTGYTTILHNPGGAFFGADIDGQPYWSANAAAFKAIIPQRTPQECLVFRATGVILPYMLFNPTTTVPTVASPYENWSQFAGGDGGRQFVCQYVPMGSAGLRTPLEMGGTGWHENPMSGLDGEYFLSLYNGRTADAQVWLKNSRISALNHATFGQLGFPMLEPITCYVPNVVPAASQAFTGMTPTRENKSAGDLALTGFNFPIPQGGTIGSGAPVFSTTNHLTCTAYGAYLTLGEQWFSDIILWSAASSKFGKNQAYNRQATLGTTTYYGIHANYPSNERVAGWANRAEGYAVAVRPTAWADGATDIERTYVDYMLRRGMEYYNDLISWIGSVVIGNGGGSASGTKSNDLTGTGIWPEDCDPAIFVQATEFIVPFMRSYMLMCYAHVGFLLKGTPSGDAVRAFLNHIKKTWVPFYQNPSDSHFLEIQFHQPVQKNRPPSVLADPLFRQMNPSDPYNSLYLIPYGSSSNPPTRLTFVSGSSNITLNAAARFQQLTTYVAEGTRVRLMRTDPGIPAPSISAFPPPAPFDGDTWYYLHYPTAGVYTTIQLCTGVDGSGNPDPATAVQATASQANVYCAMIPINTQPADSAGLGWYESQGSNGRTTGSYTRIPQFLGTVRMMLALDYPDEAGCSLSGAETTLNNMFVANALSYLSATSGTQYAWDHTRAIPS